MDINEVHLVVVVHLEIVVLQVMVSHVSQEVLKAKDMEHRQDMVVHKAKAYHLVTEDNKVIMDNLAQVVHQDMVHLKDMEAHQVKVDHLVTECNKDMVHL